MQKTKNEKDIIKKLKEENKVIPGNYDFTFKRIMSDSKTRDFICYIVSEIIGFNFSYVKEHMRIENGELLKKSVISKGMVMDVVLNIRGVRVILEMNRNSGKWQNDKNFRYVCSLYNQGIVAGEGYMNIRPVILIDFNYNCGDQDKLIRRYRVQIDDGEKIYTEKMEIYAVRIDKVKDISYSESTRLEKCFMMLDEENKDRLALISKGDPMLESVKEVLFNMSMDESMIGVYNLEEERRLEMDSYRSEGFADGKEEGIVIGLAEGRAEGIEQGKIQIIQNMIQNHFDVQTISTVTGLSKDKIKQIFNS